jgi:hypothetical protein
MFKKSLILALAASAGFAAAQDYVNNGDFESHDPFQNGSWGLYNSNGGPMDSVPYWFNEATDPDLDPSGANNPIELGTPATYGVMGDASNTLLELDSTGNSKVSQIILDPVGAALTITFDYAQRVGTDPSTNTFAVLWNDQVLDIITPTSTTMTTGPGYGVVGTGMDKLSFEAIGPSDSYGGEIDNVHAQAVPEPISMSLLGLGALAAFRRKKA